MTEESIFTAALEKRDPAERSAYLDEACAGQPELRRQVEELLRAHDEAGTFLQQPPVGLTAGERPGSRIGPYKLLQTIGEGGMGVVWMADQEAPVRRRVALKVIKPGMDSAAVIARFEAERQALALMDHPNIARVFDAGTTEAGRPFFVMELVKGVSITRYCDDNKLTPRQRLELFVPVCQALQHAHQKGIIHRDIKPSNVLVTLYDGRPVPKVIDFGVAKALHQRLTERTLFTQFGAVVGTLEYMSPEQAELNALDVDTRSDVYGLGVLLYELLTGTTPLDHKDLRAAGFAEMLRLIREAEPPRPSNRLSASGPALAAISAQRQTEPARLARLVRGELDWIVMRALEKDRNRRYGTAAGLARDVERYLADEPVQACPPSAAYRLRKFVRKQRRAMRAAGCLALLLLAAASLIIFLVTLTARQRMLAEALRAEAAYRQERAEREAAIARGREYAARGKFAEAEEILGKAAEDLRRVRPPEDSDTLAVLVELARVYQKQGKHDRAVALLVRCVRALEQKMPESWERSEAQSLLGDSLRAQGKYAEAEPLLLAGYNGMKSLGRGPPGSGRRKLSDAGERIVRLYQAWGKKAKAAEWRAKVKAEREGNP